MVSVNSPVDAQYTSIREQLQKIGCAHVSVMAVVKKQPVERILEAERAGLRLWGVNYVQEAKPLRERVHEGSWHFIGTIQSRKVKDLVFFDCVESCDRLEIVKALSDEAMKQGKKLSVLIQVNIGEEKTKSGVLPSEVDAFVEEVLKFPGIHLRGFMALPPPLEPVEKRAPFFSAMRQIFDRHAHLGLEQLSMGTSDDYLIAAREGATTVRLGTCLLGSRS